MKAAALNGWARRGMLAAYMVAIVGTWMAFLTPTTIALALKIRALSRDDVATRLSVVLMVGAVVASICSPLFGRWSDRYLARGGRRLSFIAIGLASGAIVLSLLPLAPSVAWLVVGWSCAQLAFNAALPSLWALMGEAIDVKDRGIAAGFVSASGGIGIVAGLYLVADHSESLEFNFAVPAVLGLVAAVPLMVMLSRQAAPAPRLSFQSPARRANWDLVRALLPLITTRALLTGAVTLHGILQPVYLMQQLSIDEGHAARLMAQAMTLQLVLGTSASLAVGWLCARFGGHGLALTVTSLLCSAGALTLGLGTGVTAYWCAILFFGVGVGAHLATGTDWVAAKFGSAGEGGSSMAVLNLANTVPQILAPLGIVAISAFSRDLAPIYFVSAMCALLAGMIAWHWRPLPAGPSPADDSPSQVQ